MEQNLLTREASSSAEEVAQLIFRSGFSTAEQVTEVSGRGVGMDAVRAFLEKEGGSIAIRFLDDRLPVKEGADFRPFETVISLPDRFAASIHAAMSFEALRAGGFPRTNVAASYQAVTSQVRGTSTRTISSVDHPLRERAGVECRLCA